MAGLESAIFCALGFSPKWGCPRAIKGFAALGSPSPECRTHAHLCCGRAVTRPTGLDQILGRINTYALSASTRGYNTNRGPVNFFAGRFHRQF
jgi:hypothetical protein